MSMKIAFVRTMPIFSMDAYADSLIAGIKAVCPDWEIIELAPKPFDRHSKSPLIRSQKVYERFWKFPRRAQQQVADIFHIIDHSDAHIVRWLKSVDRPVVVTCHDLINFLYPMNLQSSVRLPLVSDRLSRYSIQGMKDADTIVAVSSVTAKSIGQVLKIEMERISVIPNTVDSIFCPIPNKKSQAFRHQLEVPLDMFCLLNVGSNHPRKNIITILHAINILKQQKLPIQLWKVSDNFSDEDLQYIAANNLEDSIKYLGYLDKSTLVQAYNAANVLIAPSLHEGFGITLLEAMACGTPVITSNVSAMPEVVDAAGVLVNPNSAQDIANAVSKLHGNADYCQQLSEKGLKRVKLYTREVVAEQMRRVYERLVKK